MELQQKEENDLKMCLVCKKNPITFQCMPCRCEVLCRTCSMKMASGGKCKICKEFFVECKRIIKEEK